MPKYVAANRATSKLAAALSASSGSTTLQLDPADASRFPPINHLGATTDEYTMLTLVDAAKHYENLRVTRHDAGSSSFTVVRGQENSEIRAWQIGDSVTLRLTAGVMTDLFDAGYRCQVSDIQPTNPTEGAFWFDSSTGQLWIWFVSETGGQWVAPGAVQLIGDGAITSSMLNQSGIALPDGSTGVTQAVDDDSTLLATTEWVQLVVAGNAVADASVTQKGVVELATSDETVTGTDAARAVTPAGLQAKVATTSARGIVELATNAECLAGTDAERAVTPAGLKAGLNASGSAPVFSCRAWVNFNGATGAIRGSGNVSSVTRSNTGDYVVNFTTAMANANYAAIASRSLETDGSVANDGMALIVHSYTTTSVSLHSGQDSGPDTDPAIFSLAIFG